MLPEQSFRIAEGKETYDKILEHFKKQNPEKIDHIDGMSFYFPDYWFNIRFSKTEPVLRLTIESESEKKAREKAQEIKEFLKSL
jgi:phosphomannomutase